MTTTDHNISYEKIYRKVYYRTDPHYHLLMYRIGAVGYFWLGLNFYDIDRENFANIHDGLGVLELSECNPTL